MICFSFPQHKYYFQLAGVSQTSDLDGVAPNPDAVSGGVTPPHSESGGIKNPPPSVVNGATEHNAIDGESTHSDLEGY